MAKNWAICIGVNHYDHLTPLQYAEQDAQAMQQFLEGQAGFNRVWLFTTSADRRQQPNRNTLCKAIDDLLREARLRAGDNFWFFSSGHRMRHEGRDYLMPADSYRTDPVGSAIPTSFITDRLGDCGADNVVLLLDACRNDENAPRGVEGLGNQTAEAAEQTGVITIFSCQPREYSYELGALQQGAFTAALLEGLSVQGRCATVARLNNYLQTRVGQLIAEHRSPQERQTPRTVADPLEKQDFVLMPQYATQGDIDRLKLHAYRAQSCRDWTRSRRLWIQVNAAAMGRDLEVIEALERLAMQANAAAMGYELEGPEVGEQLAMRQAELANQLPLLTFSFKTARVDERGKIVEERDGQAEYFDEDLGDGVKLRMVAIPGGQFRMGSPESETQRLDSEGPQHEVRVSPFCLGEFPVTQAQWRAVANQGAKIERNLKPEPSNFSGSDELPVERLSWDDAVEFCARLSKLTGKDYRLPSEAEWEYACRAGTTTPFHFGPTITTDLANYDGNYTYASGPKGVYRDKTTPRGTFKFANAFGLLDMHGNVWEWCADPWHDNYQGAPDKAVIWSSSDESEIRRVQRGGSWLNFPRNCRSAHRGRAYRDNRDNDIGFRVACGAARTLPSSL